MIGLKINLTFQVMQAKRYSSVLRYVTDAAVNGEGFMLDDVTLEAAGYTSDFEADDGGWVAEGFGAWSKTFFRRHSSWHSSNQVILV